MFERGLQNEFTKPWVLLGKCFPKFITSEWIWCLAYELQHLPIHTRLQAMTYNGEWLTYPCNGSHTQSINIKHRPAPSEPNAIVHVNEYPTMHYFGNSRNAESMIAYMFLNEYFWKFL